MKTDEGIVDAAEMGHEHITHVPWAQVGVQTFNLGCLVVLLVYLLRHAVKAHFANRAKEYGQLVVRAEAARQEAERGKVGLETRLRALEQDAEAQLRAAKDEGDRLSAKLQAEAKALSTKLMQEAERSVSAELAKAKAELRSELLTEALESSRQGLSSSLDQSSQKKLRAEFLDQIRSVRP